MNRLSRAFAVVLVAAGSGSIAFAHESAPGARLRIDRVEPSVSRLFVTVRNVLAPIVQVRNDTGRTFEAIGSDGLPFLRLDGRSVQANIASPDWYRSESPSPAGWVSPNARAGAKPRWVQISTGDGWAWFEHRIGAHDPAQETTSWVIPARLGDQTVAIHGSWVRAELRGSFRSVLDEVRPATVGFEVRILPGNQPAIYVNNTTGKVLEIPGRRDEPFLRIGPRGAEQADPSGTFAPLGSAPRWAWVEPRAGWEGEDPPDNVLRSKTTVRLHTWGIAGTLDGGRIEMIGHIEWVPVASHHQAEAPGGGSSMIWILAGSVLGLAGAIVAIRQVRNRRASASHLG